MFIFVEKDCWNIITCKNFKIKSPEFFEDMKQLKNWQEYVFKAADNIFYISFFNGLSVVIVLLMETSNYLIIYTPAINPSVESTAESSGVDPLTKLDRLLNTGYKDS